MPTLSVHRVTRYRYAKPVAFGEHRMTFRPREGYDQRITAADRAIINSLTRAA